jgi:nucleotidyltransferase substrate binding protein (TIGR01987 family)
MTPERLDISSFTKAVARLEEGLARYEQNTDDDQIRDGLIQRFEFTYELGHKILKRHLEMTSATPDMYDTMAFQDIIRTGNEQGLLLGDWSAWKNYRGMRAKTSQTYDEEVALEVSAIIPDFLREARFLRDKLIERGHE